MNGRGGQPEAYCHRQMLDAIRYLVDNGIKWRAMPVDFPAWDRVYAFFRRWRDNRLISEFHDRLRDRVRQSEGRNTEPSAAIIDSQSVKAAASVPAASRGFDAGNNINGRKRHVIVDCLGLLLMVLVTPANVTDRQAACGMLPHLRARYRRIRLLWADGGYSGRLVDWAREHLRLAVQIVKRTDDISGFTVLPRRWCVEICQAQCTYGVCCSGVSVQMRRLYQPGGRVRRSRSSASSCWSARAMRRWGQQLSRRTVIQPRLIQV